MKKRIILLLALFVGLTVLMTAQTMKLVNQTHYVIVFECTLSMDQPRAFEDGDYSVEARDVTRVWESAKIAQLLRW